MSDHKKDIDQVSGIETTGHEWDGLKELNNPLPRWWLWTWYVTIVWAVGYCVLYPSWPLLTDYTKGVLGHSNRAEGIAAYDALIAKRLESGAGLKDASVEDILGNDDLRTFAVAQGAAAFGDNCSACHGSGAAGSTDYPNLLDDDWLWGGTIDAIHETLRVGIRSGHDEERANSMTAFGRDEILEKEDIVTVSNYVLSISGQPTDDGADLEAGKVLFEENCTACHGEDAKGLQEMGAPNLTDAIWLYGGSRETIIESVTNGRNGVMPSWEARLDPVTIKSLAVYVHTRGGGQ
ncbi:cytochrome-c oxidase, cbb3-type subunit III [Cohaesibacter celericrescens]|uniref:Cbb3-type cytochrome c oxidase subunit n=1 Tax=Cohaesibacter celericrescens TaxID=2067669 RepID=A0A2N5XKD9_9HYPH|nr:cytochrome-c oxidase, cbb3-type subunit III [Cohaesibacter celericrescens]PLW74897.1 cytochrome-c oxidase, cbb3-type subunit III [Cohaesibacter celericrescens]